MKLQYIILLLICALPQQFLGQYQIEGNDLRNKFYEIGQESIFVHYNDNLLFVGEQLYYKIYCLNAEEHTLSDFSKIAYIELVSSDRQQVFRHKIRLSSGMGQGDFFIPASVASGSYKLIAYTQWMRNFDPNLIFISDLSIINPYLDLTPSTANHSLNLSESELTNAQTETIKLKLPKTEFKSREEVGFSIQNTLGISGSFSIAVRKKQPFTQKQHLSFKNYQTLATLSASGSPMTIKDSIFLPETRGEIISGKLLNTEDQRTVPGELVAISIPESDGSIIKFSQTNSSGRFFTVIDDPRVNGKINISGPNLDKQQYRFVNTTNPPINYSYLDFPAFEIATSMQQEIIEYSIQNQIENAYIQHKADSLLLETGSNKVYESYTTHYTLDDYNRFSSFRETVVEIIDDVFIKKNKGGFTLMLRAEDEYFVDSSELPLVVVDGIVISDISPLLSFSANNIEKISLIKGNHYIGPQKFHGIISIKTKQSNFHLTRNDQNSTIWELPAPQPLKKYFTPGADGASLKTDIHLPDFRKQLLWEPQLFFSSEDMEIHCFTSDVKGNFEIRLEGLSREGKSISAIANFTVE